MSDLSGETGTATGPRQRRWLMPVLVVSLLINVGFVGLLAGHLFFRPHHAGDFGMSRIIRSLPREARDPVRKVMEQHRPQVAAKIAALRQARQEAHAAMAADPFDRAKLESAFANLEKASAAVQAELHVAMTDAIANLSPDARSKLAEWAQNRR